MTLDNLARAQRAVDEAEDAYERLMNHCPEADRLRAAEAVYLEARDNLAAAAAGYEQALAGSAERAALDLARAAYRRAHEGEPEPAALF